ncbi:VOC family protein [Achromobacter deleyi]|uniref:VOC family protein n=1 Tax=Achromobacter deleyi TaxID=1353891 RepID=UPI00149269C8|nr:VOC family protein [Achromobacter deleyi]QVQ28231.1 VOC family protein [Achromobacter deleyi]UIP18426.1 VOC family protein [Achromobacter deleyi]
MLTKLGCTFHHLGVACRDLDAEQRCWETLGYTLESPEFDDPIQRVRGRFLVGPGPRLELLTPTAADSPVEGVIKRRNKIYHQAFETTGFDAALEALEDTGARRTAEPASAIAFGGRRIVFLFLPNGNLLELIEAAGGG